MFSLFKKEVNGFLGSLIGYLSVLVFLLVTGLFLWVFPSVYNIPDSGYATLQGLFELAPWLYLFLIPAITMRFFADEKRTGTMELLLTKPISDFQLVMAKYWAGMLLVALSLLPTLLYFFSVYQLGNPIGNIDTGATWGAFIGLFLLASVYLAIGVFCSSLTDNQIIAFVLSVIFSFLFYIGFNYVADSGIGYLWTQFFNWLSIDTHYRSISRGVIDMRDILYFAGVTFLILYLNAVTLRKVKWKQRKTRIRLMLIFSAFVVLFFVAGNFLWRYDLTSDKRFSLSTISKEVVLELEHPVDITFYLTGELQPGLRKLQQEVVEKVAVLNAYSPQNIRVSFRNPYAIASVSKRQAFIDKLVQQGIRPTSFRQKTDKGVSTKLIFPGATIRYNGKQQPVNFLKYNPDFSHDANFNHSVESVEFELMNAFQRLTQSQKSTIAFLEDNNELDRYQTMDIANELHQDFNLIRLLPSQLSTNNPEILIIANPKTAFTEKDKFQIDQYIMQGGKVVWLVNPVQVSLDSLSRGLETYSFPLDLNISDMLFTYGVRLNYNLLQDVQCVQIKVNTAPQGETPQFTNHPWYYSPLLVPNDNHPLSRNLNLVKAEFASTIDTLSASEQVKKRVILSSSPYARTVKSPSSVSLRNIDNPPARTLFNQSFLPVGVLLEGSFTSIFRNRMIDEFNQSDKSFLPVSKPTQMVVIADGGIIANKVKYAAQPPQIQQLGYDRVSGRTFGNKEFLLNTIYYLNDKTGIMHLRNRTIKLRLLDKVKLREEKVFWQWLNVIAPMLLIVIIGIIYNFIRKRKYAR